MTLEDTVLKYQGSHCCPCTQGRRLSNIATSVWGAYAQRSSGHGVEQATVTSLPCHSSLGVINQSIHSVIGPGQDMGFREGGVLDEVRKVAWCKLFSYLDNWVAFQLFSSFIIKLSYLYPCLQPTFFPAVYFSHLSEVAPPEQCGRS